LLEGWLGANSHNHQTFGSVSEYFYNDLAGIQSPMENTWSGYRHIHLQPVVPAGLTSADASGETVAGKIISGWTKGEGSFQYQVSIPANTTGTVVIPVSAFAGLVLTEGDIKVWEDGDYLESVQGIKEVENGAGNLRITIGSGS